MHRFLAEAFELLTLRFKKDISSAFRDTWLLRYKQNVDLEYRLAEYILYETRFFLILRVKRSRQDFNSCGW